LLLLLLIQCKNRCTWGRCGRCGRCGVSWHPVLLPIRYN